MVLVLHKACSRGRIPDNMLKQPINAVRHCQLSKSSVSYISNAIAMVSRHWCTAKFSSVFKKCSGMLTQLVL